MINHRQAFQLFVALSAVHSAPPKFEPPPPAPMIDPVEPVVTPEPRRETMLASNGEAEVSQAKRPSPDTSERAGVVLARESRGAVNGLP
jgi:hypothetical protein